MGSLMNYARFTLNAENRAYITPIHPLIVYTGTTME